ncbi:WD40 repeat domain-containing protein [Micromonospora sp. WMMD737]|uniref:WD40 repeat domain-containing protein n=1 Tax=Micromonospora sp. WMMD737 TaxID=3404113 RepID=UPI003B937830
MAAADEWLRVHRADLSPAGIDHVTASRRRQRWTAVLWRATAAVLAVLLAATATFAVLLQRRGADLDARVHELGARDLAQRARDLMPRDLNGAALAALAAFHTEDNAASRSALFSTYAQLADASALLPDTRDVRVLAVAADPPSLITAYPRLLRWTFDGGRPASTPLADDEARQVVTDASGTRIAWVGPDYVEVILPDDRRLRLPFTGTVTLQGFDPTGQRLALLNGPTRQPQRAVLWDLASDTQRVLPPREVRAAWFTSESGTMIFEDGAVWNPRTNREVGRLPGVRAVSPDGRLAVRCGTAGGSLEAWRISPPRRLRTLPLNCLDIGDRLYFDPAGEVILPPLRFAGLNGSRTVRVKAVATGRLASIALPPVGGDPQDDRQVPPVAVPTRDGFPPRPSGRGGLPWRRVTARLDQVLRWQAAKRCGSDRPAFDGGPPPTRSSRPGRRWGELRRRNAFV